ncbi:MAG: hypothetical protein AB7R40_26560, partial [Nitrospiraceae bacterium]
MSILRNPNRNRYTVIDSTALEDTAISFEAKGVLAYLLSKPDGWVIHQEHLSRIGGIGRHKMMRIFSELRKAGYIAYKKPRNEFGQVEGTEIVLCETPRRAESGAKPDYGITRESENPTVGKPDPLVNLESLVNLDTSVNLEENPKDAPPIGSDPVIDPQPSLPAKRKNPIFSPALMDIPEWLDGELWAAWCEERAAKRKPITYRAGQLQIKKLAEYREQGFSPQEVIEHSIASGYQGLFPPRGNQHENRRSNSHGFNAIDPNDESWLTDDALAYIESGREIGNRVRA